MSVILSILNSDEGASHWTVLVKPQDQNKQIQQQSHLQMCRDFADISVSPSNLFNVLLLK